MCTSRNEVTRDREGVYPRTEFVADFVGSANLIRGRPRPDLASGDTVAVETDGGQIVHGVAHGRQPGAAASLSVRTVHLALSPERRGDGRNTWPVAIHHSVFLGDLTQVHVDWGGRDLIVRQTGMQAWSEGQPAVLSVAPEHCVLLEEA